MNAQMTSRRALKGVLRAALLLVAASSAVRAAEQTTVELRSGAMVRGQVLIKQADRIVLDLGFTVLSVPIEAVHRVLEGEAGAGGEPSAASDEAKLYFAAGPERPTLTVRENVHRCGEAVVQVRTPTGLGSGFVIDPAGYVITNDHVIAGEHQISITVFKAGRGELTKEQLTNVRIIATNPYDDLALLRIESDPPRTFAAVPLGDSDALRQGQTVFAIGSPLGLERSVSQGIVSLRNRAMEGRLYIQTTTQINPGNSGGPLFGLGGEVVGVTNMKIAGFGTEGLGFAIPVNVLRYFLANRDAFAFDPRHPNAGFRYHSPPTSAPRDAGAESEKKP